MTLPHAVPPASSPAASLRMLVRPVLLLAVFAVLAVAVSRMPGLRHMLAAGPALHSGVRGVVLFVAVASLSCAVGLPRQMVCFAAGAAYGIGVGCVLATLATVAGALCGYGWGRWAGGARRMPARLDAVMARLDALVGREPFAAVLMLRLMPVGSALLLSLASGMLGVRVMPFMFATLLGSLPQTVVFVLVGAGTRLDGGLRIGIASVLFGLSALVGLWLMRRMRNRAV